MKHILLILVTLAALSCKKDDGRYKDWGTGPNPSVNQCYPNTLPGYWMYRQDPRTGRVERIWIPPTTLSDETIRAIEHERAR